MQDAGYSMQDTSRRKLDTRYKMQHTRRRKSETGSGCAIKCKNGEIEINAQNLTKITNPRSQIPKPLLILCDWRKINPAYRGDPKTLSLNMCCEHASYPECAALRWQLLPFAYLYFARLMFCKY